MPCQHPPARLYAGNSSHPMRAQGQTLNVPFIWIACSDCRKLLKKLPDDRECKRAFGKRVQAVDAAK